MVIMMSIIDRKLFNIEIYIKLILRSIGIIISGNISIRDCINILDSQPLIRARIIND